MENTNKNTSKTAIIVAVLGIISYISLLFGDNLWMDEAFSAMIVKGSFARMLQSSNSDTLPPLYNILNWCMTQIFGFNSPSLRIMSVLPMTGCLILSATVIRKKLGDWVSIIFSLCMAGAPQLFFYGTEIRMYALSLFLVTLCLCSVLDAPVFSKRDRILFILSAALCGWTHHFALVAASFICLYVLILSLLHRKEDTSHIKNTLLSFAGIALLYIPCFINTLQQMKRVTGYFSMPDADIHTVISCLKQPFITENTIMSLLLLLMFLCALIFGIYLFIKNKDRLCLTGLIFISLYPLVMLFGFLAVLILKSNIFSQRYLIPALGAFWLGFSILTVRGYEHFRDMITAKERTSPKKYRMSNEMKTSFISIVKPYQYLSAAIICILVAISIHSYILTFSKEYDQGVKQMRAYFNENVKEGDKYLIIEDNYEREIAFRYYFPGFEKTDWDKISENETGTLWYIEVPGYSDKLDIITEHGYDYKLAGEFKFDRYEFKLYKLQKWNF